MIWFPSFVVCSLAFLWGWNRENAGIMLASVLVFCVALAMDVLAVGIADTIRKLSK